MLAALRPLTQRGDAHLGLAVVTRAAQTRVVSLGGEVVALIYHIVLYIHTRLPCGGEKNKVKTDSQTKQLPPRYW